MIFYMIGFIIMLFPLALNKHGIHYFEKSSEKIGMTESMVVAVVIIDIP